MIRHENTVSNFLTSLKDEEILSVEAANRATAVHEATHQPIDMILRELGLLSEDRICHLLARYFDYQVIDEITNIDHDLLMELGTDFTSSHGLVPLIYKDNRLILLADPYDTDTLNSISYFLDQPVMAGVSTRSKIEEFYVSLDALDDDNEELNSEIFADEDDVSKLMDIASEAPVVKFVSKILQQAVDQKATDIHIEPQEDILRIRLRKDGVLSIAQTVSRSLASGITSRIKILSQLNISERRLPQDGRLRAVIRGNDIDFRVSIMPSIYGETIVLRILDRSNVELDYNKLGFDEQAIKQVTNIAQQQNGIILLTGPTGSGKTTTLYTILKSLSGQDSKIFTVEDPIEYRLAGVTQLQIDPDIGLTFSQALRSVLRQDPDIILIGEIRDRETADIAIQAALTGHLVLSTLHTNSAVGAISRLKDMGVESYLIAATLRGIISQRLVRKLCPSCELTKTSTHCDDCMGLGYAGRCAAYEILELTDTISEAIQNELSEDQIQKIAIGKGMQPIAKHAQHLIETGKTDEMEIHRVFSQLGG